MSAIPGIRMSEKQLLGFVKSAARVKGWQVFHNLWSVGSDKGFPDLVLIRPPRLIFAELKSDIGRPTVEQRMWLELLGLCPGVDVFLWRPKDRDAILEALE